MKSRDKFFKATIYYDDLPYGVISFSLEEMHKDNNVVFKKSSDDLENVLCTLKNCFPDINLSNLYITRTIRVYDKKTISVIKPNERRFWTVSSALNDADETLAELLLEEKKCLSTV